MANTTTTLTPDSMLAKATNDREINRKKLAEEYRQEDKIAVTLSPFYAPYLGRNAMISVQGVAVYVPADGRLYYVNKTHAAQLLDAVSRIDASVQKQNRMGDVKNNFETSAGSLRLV